MHEYATRKSSFGAISGTLTMTGIASSCGKKRSETSSEPIRVPMLA